MGAVGGKETYNSGWECGDPQNPVKILSPAITWKAKHKLI